MKQVHEMLAASYGDYVAHALDFKVQQRAERYLASFSFTSGRTLEDFSYPDRMKLAPVLLPIGVFVILGGRFSRAEHEEIRRRADEYGVECKSPCIADDDTQVKRDFMVAAARLRRTQTTNPVDKKWWQIWK